LPVTRTVGLVAILLFVASGVFLSYNAYYNSYYAVDRAVALLSRAETSGFAEDMIAYMQRGRVLLPDSGNPVWWFPTDRTDFTEIQKDIDGINARAQILEGLPRNSSSYQQGMDDLRGKIRTLETQVIDARGYMLVSLWNTLTSAVWAAAFAIAFWAARKR